MRRLPTMLGLGLVLVSGCSFTPAPGDQGGAADAPVTSADAASPGLADAATGSPVDAPGNPRPVDAPTAVSVDATPVGPMCPAGYVALAGAPSTSRYRLLSWDNSGGSDQSRTWLQARDRCSNENTHLAVFQSAAEARAVEEALEVNPDSPYVWVGVSDLAVEGTWVAVPGGAPAGFWINWAPGQPNDGDQANCMLQFAQQQFDWNCQGQYPFACECE